MFPVIKILRQEQKTISENTHFLYWNCLSQEGVDLQISEVDNRTITNMEEKENWLFICSMDLKNECSQLTDRSDAYNWSGAYLISQYGHTNGSYLKYFVLTFDVSNYDLHIAPWKGRDEVY